MNAQQLKESLLSHSSKPVPVPFRAGLFVRVPGYKDSLRIESLAVKHGATMGEEERKQLHTGYLLAFCLVDENGSPVFTGKDDHEAAQEAMSMFAPLAFQLLDFVLQVINERKKDLGKVSETAQQPSG